MDRLTDLQKRIAILVSEGKTNRQIGRLIAISPHTVNYHLRQMFRKLNIQSRSQLAAIVPPPR